MGIKLTLVFLTIIFAVFFTAFFLTAAATAAVSGFAGHNGTKKVWAPMNTASRPAA
jgi:hypothetical protein